MVPKFEYEKVKKTQLNRKWTISADVSGDITEHKLHNSIFRGISEHLPTLTLTCRPSSLTPPHAQKKGHIGLSVSQISPHFEQRKKLGEILTNPQGSLKKQFKVNIVKYDSFLRFVKCSLSTVRCISVSSCLPFWLFGGLRRKSEVLFLVV